MLNTLVNSDYFICKLFNKYQNYRIFIINIISVPVATAYFYISICVSNMVEDLNNKVVLITGGANGIGLAIADKFLQKGAKVTILLDVNGDQGKKSAMNLCSKHGADKAVFMKCDVTKDLDLVFTEVMKAYKTVDVLVNNAGVADENSKNTISINVLALIDWSLKYREHMRIDKGGKGGTIINLASILGFRVVPHAPIYQAAKFAVMGFTKSLGHSSNFEKSGVRVVAVCPGFTETDLTAKILDFDGEFYDFSQTQLWQTVDAVASAAAEVFENAASGTAWLIEGGKPIVEV